MKRVVAAIAGAVLAVLVFAGCTSDADTASRNISTAAEQFEVQRTIVGVNGITGKTIFYAEGRCSLESADSFLAGAVEVTCRYAENEYRKHFVMLGDQDSLVITQEEAIDVSVYHTRIIIKPENIIPEFDLEVGKQ